MAAITIRDLHTNRVLDDRQMSSIQGGGAGWVYGWIRPFTEESPGFGGVVNFYQINNYADQMINQFQTIDVKNTAPNANINVALDANAGNLKRAGTM
jgi:hypothetical protein